MATWEDMTETTESCLPPYVHAHKHTTAKMHARTCILNICMCRHQRYLILSHQNSLNQLRLHTHSRSQYQVCYLL